MVPLCGQEHSRSDEFCTFLSVVYHWLLFPQKWRYLVSMGTGVCRFVSVQTGPTFVSVMFWICSLYAYHDCNGAILLMITDRMFVCKVCGRVRSLKAKRAVVRKRMAEVVFNQSRQRGEGHVRVQKHAVILLNHTGGVWHEPSMNTSKRLGRQCLTSSNSR